MKKNSKRMIIISFLCFLLSACSQNKSESEITEQFVENPSTTMSVEKSSTTMSDVESVAPTTTIDLENIEGVEYLVDRVKNRTSVTPLGISIGKNFDTPIESALDDYLICLDKVYKLDDYVAINISSPNTKNLL